MLETPGALPDWDHGLQKEVAAGPASSKTRAGLGLSRGWMVCGPESICVAFLDPMRTIHRSCGQILQLYCGFALQFLWRVLVLQWKARKELLELKYLMFFPL